MVFEKSFTFLTSEYNQYTLITEKIESVVDPMVLAVAGGGDEIVSARLAVHGDEGVSHGNVVLHDVETLLLGTGGKNCRKEQEKKENTSHDDLN